MMQVLSHPDTKRRKRQTEPDVWALMRRIARAVQSYGAEIPQDRRARILSAETDFGALLAFMADADVLAAVAGADPLMPARVRGLKRRQEMVAEAGGLLSTSESAALLGISRQAVEKRIRNGTLLGVRTGSRNAVPAFQIKDGALLDGLSRVLRKMSIGDPWMRLDFFLTADPRLDGRTPVEALAAGDIAGTERVARAFGEQGAR